MQILILDSWLREYLSTDAKPKEIQKALSLCGPSVERLHQTANDFIYDIEVTTNRVDMMSVIGIAFECVAILPRFGYTAKLKKDPYLEKLNLVTNSKVSYLDVKVDKNLCHRFSAVLIRDVLVGKSPELIANRLELAGLRSLNNIVDISNYLMIEMGQPVHTFDYDKVAGHSMILRESRAGESLATLDGKIHKLPGHDIVIEDGDSRLIDLCGIMGGANSAVDEHTKNVLLFVQTYEPVHIRKTSMALAHRTAAAVLFEKGLPVENVLPTLQLGIELFTKAAGGNPEKAVLDILNTPPKETVLKLKTPLTEFVNVRLGIILSFSEISKILNSLEFVVKSEHEVEVPWVRASDVTIPEDLVEEVARIYGYHNLPSQLMSGVLPTNRPNESEFYWVSKIKSALKYWGYTETYTYSLVPKDSGLKLKNPQSSEWTYLRTSLSHSQVISENLGRVNQLNLFEIANVYLSQKGDLPQEEMHLLISTTNPDYPKLKGVVEALLTELGVIQKINIVRDINSLSCDINLSQILPKASSIRKFTPISKFPPIIEDININLTESYSDLEKKIFKISPLIKQIELVDKYGNKLTLRVTYHSDAKQLSSEDIEPVRQKLTSLSSQI